MYSDTFPGRKADYPSKYSSWQLYTPISNFSKEKNVASNKSLSFYVSFQTIPKFFNRIGVAMQGNNSDEQNRCYESDAQFE